MKKMFQDVDKTIFGGAALLYALLFFFIIVWPKPSEAAIVGTLDFTVKRLGWFYSAAFSAVIVFLAYLAFSRFGSYKLGAPGDEPEYSFASWVGMLFGAGLGVGLVFWGVYEPLIHYVNAPFCTPRTAEAARVAMRGVAKGIKIISDANMLIIMALLALAFAFGPTQFLVNTFFETLGLYLRDLPYLSLFLDAGGEVAQRTGGYWVGMWTIKNFAWWTAFAPFVGGFLADISKGRTIREFILACVIVPSLLCFMWFTCFGGTAIGLIHTGEFGEGVTQSLLAVPQDSLFVFLRQFPLSQVTIAVAMGLVLTLVVTSVNSATFAMGTLVSTSQDEPGVGIRGFWGIFMSINAFLFIWVGGVFTLRSSSLVAALPFMIIILLMLASLRGALRDEEQNQ